LSSNINREVSDPHELENKKDLNQRFHVFAEKRSRKSFSEFEIEFVVTLRSPLGKKHELSNASSNINEGFSIDYHFESK
jgi:hypothetical protein